MKTVRNEKVAYETPVIETVELVVEGSILNDSPGGNAGGETEGDDGWA